MSCADYAKRQDLWHEQQETWTQVAERVHWQAAGMKHSKRRGLAKLGQSTLAATMAAADDSVGRQPWKQLRNLRHMQCSC